MNKIYLEILFKYTLVRRCWLKRYGNFGCLVFAFYRVSILLFLFSGCIANSLWNILPRGDEWFLWFGSWSASAPLQHVRPWHTYSTSTAHNRGRESPSLHPGQRLHKQNGEQIKWQTRKKDSHPWRQCSPLHIIQCSIQSHSRRVWRCWKLYPNLSSRTDHGGGTWLPCHQSWLPDGSSVWIVPFLPAPKVWVFWCWWVSAASPLLQLPLEQWGACHAAEGSGGPWTSLPRNPALFISGAETRQCRGCLWSAC